MIDNSQQFKDFIKQYASDDTARLRLAYAGKNVDFDITAAILQIDARRKFGKKFSEIFERFPDFYIPNMLAGEQSTSTLLAGWHAQHIEEGSTVVDLTCGLGIDALHMARQAESVTAIDRQEALTEALRFNSQGLGLDNIEAVCGDCRQFIDKCLSEGRRFDYAFIDPARRSAEGLRTFAFNDCEPDVVELLPKLKQLCKRLIIKASPMLDSTAAATSLGMVPQRITALGTATECKELDFFLDFNSEVDEPILEAVTIGGGEPVTFTRSIEQESPVPGFIPAVSEGDYVAEPYPAVMKMAPFRLLAQQYNLLAFGPGTHLYHARNISTDFPGRIYQIEAVLPYASKVIKRFARQWPVAEVAVRNFGMSAADLRKRLGVRDGVGAVRVYGVTASGDKRLLIVCKQ